MTLYEQFEAEFKPKLGHTKRWEAFSLIAKELLSLESPFILETGCLRQPDNWEGDGQSTRVWNWIIEKAEGLLSSVDIEDRNCAVAEEYCNDKYASVTTMDSIKYLRTEQCHYVDNLNLLYLDSFDYKPGKYHLAELHHIGELACVYDELPSGCLIAVDDCHSDTFGKHVLVKAFFDRLNVQPVLKSYITIWRKP